ncbi:MAG: DNA repair protein RecN [Candidatus Aminicenantales bacterium]
MIKFLRIRNLATIEDLQLDLEEGFSILTGETGVGKSIIIDSLRLLLGERGSADLLRTGKSEAVVEAVFDTKEASGLPPDVSAEDGELIIQRQITEQGTGKAYLGGVLVPLKKLKDTGAGLVDIYGQHDHVFLLNLDNHLNFLDSFGTALPLRQETGRLAQELRQKHKEKQELEASQRDAAQRLDFLEYQIKEIEAAGLRPGEEAELLQQRHILKNAEKIASLVEGALDIASEREESLQSLIARLRSLLAELSGFDPAFREIGDSLEPADITLREVTNLLLKYKDRQSVSPENLEKIEERLSLIEKLKRKYGQNLADIQVHFDRIKEERDRLVHGEESLSEVKAGIDKLFREYSEKAGRLSEKRLLAARELQDLVEKEVGQLGMKKARFEVQVQTSLPDREQADKARDSGQDEVEFLISPNPGEQLRPLRKIASGGELSRVMLALKSIGREQERLKTLIFDEIDAGIGGKTAEFIAQKLKELARRHQVICITHLPQIASHARHHFRIEKRVEKNRTYTTVQKLGFEERVEEIARLISGSRLTEAALQNAREMLTHNLGPG